MKALLERIDRARKGRADATISKAAGLNPDFIRDLRRKQNSPAVDNVEALARALGKTPWWLAFGYGPEEMSDQTEIHQLVADMPEEMRTEAIELLRLWKDLKPGQLQGIVDFVRHSLPSAALQPGLAHAVPVADEPNSP